MSTLSYPHISLDPTICGGKPCIAGRRVRVMDVVIEHESHGSSPEEICRAFAGLTLAEVHAALAYFYDHSEQIRQEIDDELRAEEEFLGLRA